MRWSCLTLVLAAAACGRDAAPPSAHAAPPTAAAPALGTSTVDAGPPALMLARPGCTAAEHPAPTAPDCATPPR